MIGTRRRAIASQDSTNGVAQDYDGAGVLDGDNRIFSRRRSTSSALVPIGSPGLDNNQLVLLYGNTTAESDAVVLYDCEQRSIMASNVSGLASPGNVRRRCPLCNTLFGETSPGEGSATSTANRGQAGVQEGWPSAFISDAYFSILDYMHRTQQITLHPNTGVGVMRSESTSSFNSDHGQLPSQHSTGFSASDTVNPFIFDTAAMAGGGGGVEEASSELRQLSSGMLVNGYFARFFVERRKLGVGSFGTVYLCHHVIDTVFLGEFAVKLVPVGDSREWLRGMMKEVKALERLSAHPNIVSYKHSWLEMHRASEVCPFVPYLFILMSYCNAGSLEDLIWSDKGSNVIPDEPIWPLFLDTLQGLQHLHRNYVLHRDLKPSNILLCQDPNAPCGLHAVLSDFGTVEIAGETESSNKRHSGFTGTIEYTAPEVLGDPSHEYSEQSDMWSLGIVLYAMCYSKVPYSDLDPQKCAAMILEGNTIDLPEIPARDGDLKEIIKALTVREALRRPRCDDLLYHPFVRQKVVEVRYSRSPDYNLRPSRASPTGSAAPSESPDAPF